MMIEQEAKEFMAKPLPERFRIFMLKEMCDEAGYGEKIRNNDYNYLPILQRVKEQMQVEFFAYFHVLLYDEVYEKYKQAFMHSLFV